MPPTPLQAPVKLTDVDLADLFSDKSEFKAQLPRRLQPTDFFAIRPWLFPKLKQRWPGCQDMTFAGWLQGYVSSNTHCAFLTDNAIAVGIVQSDIRDAFTYVELLWIVHNKGHAEEALACIREVMKWGERCGAVEFRFKGGEGDISGETIAAALSPQGKATIWAVKLNKVK